MILKPVFVRKPARGVLFLSGVLLLSLLLAACGGSTPQQANKQQTPLSINALEVGDWPRNFNPYSANVITGAQGMIYETLMYYNRFDGTAKPWLASSQQLSSDGTSVTYHLRQGVKWSDGQAFSSDDVLFTLNMLQKYPGLDGNGLWNTLKSVTAPDASTIVVTFKTSSPPILWYLGGQTYIVAKHTWSSVKGDPSQYLNPNPIGTGPYVLSNFTPQLYSLVKNPGYWQPGKPEVNKLTFPAYDGNTTAELALDQGKLGWAGLYIPKIEQTYISRDSAHNHYWFPASDTVYLALNLAKPPFDQLPLREAINLAIDRDQISKIGENGFEPVAHPTALLLPYQKNLLSSDYSNVSFSMNAAKAIQLLDGAGFTKGSDGIYSDKGGKKLSFNLNVVQGYTDWITDCQILVNNLKAIGIKATVNILSYDAYYSALQQGKYDISLASLTAGPTPYYWFNQALASSNTAPVGQNANSNFERWQDKATDGYLSTLGGAASTAQQQQAMAGIEKVMVEQLPIIPLVNEPYWTEYSTAHYTGWPDATHLYAAPAPFTAPDCEIVLLNIHAAG